MGNPIIRTFASVFSLLAPQAVFSAHPARQPNVPPAAGGAALVDIASATKGQLDALPGSAPRARNH